MCKTTPALTDLRQTLPVPVRGGGVNTGVLPVWGLPAGYEQPPSCVYFCNKRLYLEAA